MNQELINTIMYQMNLHLDNYQLMKLNLVLEEVMNVSDDLEDNYIELLERFIATRKLEGRWQ